ncbi:MAG: hypothetical protein ACRDHN_06805 [Thermomicrobiales bacterium]
MTVTTGDAANWWEAFAGMGASVDFVVFGFGVSALLMLGGFGLRDLGPWLFGRSTDEFALPEFEDAKTMIRKQTLASVGNAVSAAGAGVALVTVAALLGKTTDEIGAIVVGMSLVLAAVGVGAWSYDIFRRYRSAMDIVTAQENSVRTRIQARDARDRALRPQPKPEPKTTPKPVVETIAPETETTATTTSRPEPSFDDGPEEIDFDAPLPDWHDEEPTSSPEFEPVVTPAVDIEPIVEEPIAAEAITPIESPDEEAVTPFTSAPLTSTTTTTTRPVFSTTLPPEPLDDTLIDEAVRIEPLSRFSSRGNAPSWLFDDLESDLDQQGSDQDDPIDRFREAKPVTRPSALERLLAEDKAKRTKPSDDDSES